MAASLASSSHDVNGINGVNGSTDDIFDAKDFYANVKSVDEALRRLSGLGSSASLNQDKTSMTSSPSSRGKRIAEYERAMAPSHYRRDKVSPVVFQVVPGSGSANSRSLDHLPNEILTHVFSYLPPGAHGNVALVSKRFCALVTTPHAWRLAFLRHFSGHVSAGLNGNISSVLAANDDLARSELRQFARLTNHASWRSEYLQRTGLLKSLLSGRPGASIGVRGEGFGTKGSSGKPKKATAVITYNTPLLGPVTHMQAHFGTSSKKTPRVIHGSSLYGVATSSNPQLGRSEGWGYHEMYVAPQFEEVNHTLSPYGLGSGRGYVGIPNVMDTSPLYGMIVGEGFPGGRPWVRFMSDRNLAVVENAPRNRFMEPAPDMPVIPEDDEGVTAVWAAKSVAVPTMTNFMVGFLVGSSLGVISAYSLDKVNSSSRYPWSHVTARWVVCPGVPIVAITADDNYSEKRRAGRRVWAVALNALGEVYYLKDVPPSPPSSVTMPQESTGLRASYERENLAWKAGRSVAWELVEASRRTVGRDEFDSVRTPALKLAASPSPRLSPDSDSLDLEKRTAEAREIEKFFKLMPGHFRAVYDTWDMRRRLEVDFAGGSTPYESSNNSASGIAENVIVISCGVHGDNDERRAAEIQPASVTRYTRLVPLSATSFPANESSIFDIETSSSTPVMSIVNTPGVNTPTSNPIGAALGPTPTATIGWQTTVFALTGKNATPKTKAKMEITCSAIDLSQCAVLAPFDDPLLIKQQEVFDPEQMGSVWSEVPGRRARWLAVGTNSGQVIVWNMREHVPRPLSADELVGTSGRQVWPMRIIRTQSPSISSVAVSSLYLVHGGSDGLVQAWDPLASSTDSIRTLNAHSVSRVPRHLKHLLGDGQHQGQNQNGAGTLRNLNAGMFGHVGAIVLDPDPTELRGVLAVGTQLRFWSYSSVLGAVHGSSSRKRGRRLRHADGQLVHRSAAEKMATYIASETADLRREIEANERNRERMMQRFGVGIAGLTDEEAIQYAELISQREYMQSQQILSSSDSSQGSAGDDAALYDSSSPLQAQHSETSVSGQAGPSYTAPVPVDEEDDFELQMQRAMRLSLMEGVNEETEASSPQDSFGQFGDSSPEKGKGKGKAKEKETENKKASPPPAFASSSSAADLLPEHYLVGENEDDDLELALQLSMREEESRPANGYDGYEGHGSSSHDYGGFDDGFDYSHLDDDIDAGQFADAFVTKEEQMANDAALAELLQQDDFPALEPSYVGKGKGKR